MSTRKSKRARLTFLNFIRVALAEFFSTFIFVFAGLGSRIAFNKVTGNGAAAAESLISAALAHAFALFVAVSVSKNISGGHVNPAVTFGLFTGGNISIVRGLIYWISQLLGSIVACLVLWLVTGEKSIPSFGLFAGAGVGSVVMWEIVMAFGLVLTVYTTAIDPKKAGTGTIAPITIGFIVGANILAGGTSLNPAVSFGPAVVSWSWANHWVYWVGPLVGSGLVGLIYEMSCISGTHLQKEQPITTTRR